MWNNIESFLFPQNARILSAKAYRLYDYRFNDFSLEDEETLKVIYVIKQFLYIRHLKT